MWSGIPSFRSAALQPAEQQDLLPPSVKVLEGSVPYHPQEPAGLQW